MWPVIGAVAVVGLLITAVIVYARKGGISDARLEQAEEGQEAHEREHEMVDRWTGRNLLRALRRVQRRKQRDAGTLRDDE